MVPRGLSELSVPQHRLSIQPVADRLLNRGETLSFIEPSLSFSTSSRAVIMMPNSRTVWVFDSSIHCRLLFILALPHYRLDILSLDLAVRRGERVDFERVASEV